MSLNPINAREIANEYINAILKSDDKQFIISQIAQELKRFTYDEQQLILSELKKQFKYLSQYSEAAFEQTGDTKIRYQTNEEFLRYLEMLEALTKKK